MPIAGPGCRNASASVRRLVGERHRVTTASARERKGSSVLGTDQPAARAGSATAPPSPALKGIGSTSTTSHRIDHRPSIRDCGASYSMSAMAR